MKTFNQQYQYHLKHILLQDEELNRRTGVKVKSMPGITIQCDMSKEFPLVSLRKISIKNFVAEMMWFISGEKDTNKFLNKHTKIWNSFTEEDGTIETAYGYRWRHAFGRDQLGELIRLLTKDPSSRHGVIVTWDPSDDGLLGPKKKNVPCPYTFTVNIINGKLNLHNIIRSNDMILGFPTDAAGFGLLQLILSEMLGVEPGIYTHSISNAHIYNNHYDAAKEMIDRPPFHQLVINKLPEHTYRRAKLLEEELFEELIELFSVYSSYPPIKGLTISL